MVKFVTDSSTDMSPDKSINLEIVPLKIYTDERDFVDDSSLDVHDMLVYLKNYKDRSYTSCPSTESWLEAFEGGDEIYCITLTSLISGAYNSACNARDIYLEKHPDAKVCVIDTLTTGPEMRLTVEKVIEWRNAGKSFDEISSQIQDYIHSTRLLFSFQSLHNFAQNGRVSKVVASAVGMLNIRILGTASPEGTIQPMYKCRGDKSANKKLISELEAIGYKGGRMNICQIEALPLANALVEEIKAAFPGAEPHVYPAHGLCSYYGEGGGIILGLETSNN